MADAEEMQAEGHPAQRKPNKAVGGHDYDGSDWKAEDSSVQLGGETVGKAGKPRPPERQEDGGPVDAEESQCADDGRNAAEHHHGSGDEAEHGARGRTGQARHDRAPSRLQGPAHRDSGKAHDHADGDVDPSHGEQQRHAQADEQQFAAIPQDGQQVVGRGESR